MPAFMRSSDRSLNDFRHSPSEICSFSESSSMTSMRAPLWYFSFNFAFNISVSYVQNTSILHLRKTLGLIAVAQDSSFLMFDPTSLTDCFQSMSSEHCTAPLR